MKPKQEKILYPVQSSFKILKYKVPYFDMHFHYHPEYELVYIIKGEGLRYIGGSIHKFVAGDMVFMGPELAHMWISTKKYCNTGSTTMVEAIVLQFSDKIFDSVIDTPEFTLIKEFLSKSKNGIKIGIETNKKVSKSLKKTLKSKGIKKFTKLLKILDILSKDKEVVFLNPIDYTQSLDKIDRRIDTVYHFVISNYYKKINIKDAAQVANMEQSAFCRFFKKKTQKTFMQFVNETRINLACQFLTENKFTIEQLAYECGFGNLSNFYRQFKKIVGKTPKDYRKEVEGD